MSEYPHITLEQWRALISVVDTGSYAAAALALNKSQSSVTYAVQKLETLLGVRAFEVQGRKAVLTSTGHLLYRRAQHLLSAATDIERAAKKYRPAGKRKSGWPSILFFLVVCCWTVWTSSARKARIPVLS